MRLKSYYATEEITNNLYTFGSEYIVQETGLEYIGIYHTYTTGEIFSSATWNADLSKKLIKLDNNETEPLAFIYQQLKPNIKTEYDSFIQYNVQIQQSDINNGFIFRYFIKKNNESNIIEINQKQYEKFEQKKIDPNLYNACKLKWIISGNLKTEIKNNVSILSVSEQNKQSIEQASKKIALLKTKLINLTEFYISNTIITPIDINSAI